MPWKKVSEIDTSSDVDEAMPSISELPVDENGRTPKALFDALSSYKRILQAKRNAAIAERAHARAARKLGPEHVDAFLRAQQDLEEAHAEWERQFHSPEGKIISLDEHAANWARKVRWR